MTNEPNFNKIELIDKVNYLEANYKKLNFIFLELITEYFGKLNKTVIDHNRIIYDFDKYRLISEISLDYIRLLKMDIEDIKEMIHKL